MTTKLRTRRQRVAGSVLAIGLASATMIFGSYAAWTATTTNPGNSVTAGTFVLTNDKDNASVFTEAGNIKPGDSGEGVVTIANGGSLPMQVTLDQLQVTSNDLAGALQLSIEEVDGSGQPLRCVYPAADTPCSTKAAWNGSSTLAALPLRNADGSGNTWQPDESHRYKVAWELPGATSGTTGQGQTASFDLRFSGAQVPDAA